jgi:5-methylcytosine-specific restriction protein A
MAAGRKAWAHQGSRHERGYGSAWVRLRAIILDRDLHLCQPCRRLGRVTPATQVDHIKPKANGGTDDSDNLQAICEPCHDAKTEADKGRPMARKVGLDGYPI